MTVLNNQWTGRYTPPPLEEMQRVGATDWNIFVLHSNSIEPELSHTIEAHTSRARGGLKILDFGCGVGRVALKMYAERRWPTHACDVNPAAINYLQQQLPDVSCAVTDYDPPLPYEDNFFDAVVSVSIWTHIPEDAQDLWLREMRRITKPGGLALLTTSGHKALQSRHKRGDAGWANISEGDLRERGIIFVEYERFAHSPQEYPGVKSSYGLTAHDPDYIRRHWKDYFTIAEIKPAVIANVQDLVVCIKPE